MAKKLDTKILKTNDLETRLVGFKSHFRAINQHFKKSGMTARSDVTRVGCGRQWRDCGKVPSPESRGVSIRHQALPAYDRFIMAISLAPEIEERLTKVA